MNTLNPLRLYCDKSTGECDPLLWRTALNHDTLTVNRKFTVGGQGTWCGSPFQEFECKPAGNVGIAFPTKRTSYSYEEAARRLLLLIREIIATTWKPDRFHFIYHSGGFDSRIISAAIRSLYEEFGDDWLGNVVFATNKWESKPFCEIMRRQGWQEHQYYIHDYTVPDELYFSKSINISTAYEELNAPCPIPANLWHYIPTGYEAINGRLGSVQSYAGYWANEIHDTLLCSPAPDEWYRRWDHHYCFNAMAALPMYFSDINFIFLTPRYQQAIASIALEGKTDANKLRQTMANLACPSCVDVPNLHLDDRHHPISKAIRSQMVSQYHNTWYAKYVHHDFTSPTTSEFSSEWGKWSTASLCQFLIKQGVKINV